MRNHSCCILGFLALTASGAERRFDFADSPEHRPPANFRSTVTGKGKPGDWKIVQDEFESERKPFVSQPPVVTTRAVLAQVAQDRTDDHYPLLLLEDENFGDFTLTTRFKIVSGQAEQMAGLAFRIQDEKNYYYVRASALGNTFYFFKFINGELIGPIGSRIEITRGVWHELTVDCQGSQVTCSLDGKAIIPGMRQDTFPKGKIGFWTKSDSISYFADTKITYKPLEAPAQVLIREVLKKYPRLLGLKIYVAGAQTNTTQLIGSKDESAIGQPGEKEENEVIRQGIMFYGIGKASVAVTMPLRDHNGDVIAAVRVIMKTFPGQTEQNAVIRATPIIQEMQKRVSSLQDLTE